MAENYQCIKEGVISDLKISVQMLNKDAVLHGQQLEKIENKMDDLSAISVAISVMSLSLEHIVEHNTRQDEMMKSQNKTLEFINNNLNRLNQGQENLEAKVGKLEDRVDRNESLNTVDLRAINKEQKENYLKKYAGPIAIVLSLGALALQIIAATK